MKLLAFDFNSHSFFQNPWRLQFIVHQGRGGVLTTNTDNFSLNKQMSCNGPFAAERSRGTKSPNWRANDTLGHVKQTKFKFGGLFKHFPLRHLLSSLVIFVPRDP